MPFDFALVSAPFRMQPGLRRVAAGAPQLTPARARQPAPAREDGRAGELPGAGAAVDRGIRRLRPCSRRPRPRPRCGEPVAFDVDDDGPMPSAPLPRLVGARRRAARRRRSCDRHPARGPGPPQRATRPRSASPSRRTSPSSTAHTRDVPWLAVCLPSRWAPADKLGRRFAEVHAPVADSAMLVAASESLARLVTGAERWERFVWTISADPQLHQHPAQGRSRLADRRSTPRRSPTLASLSQRAPDLHADAQARASAVFTIHVDSRPLADGDRRAPRPPRRVCTTRSRACRPPCSPTAAWPGARAAAGLARDAGRTARAGHEHCADRCRRRSTATPTARRDRANTTTSTTRAPARSRRPATSSSTATASRRAGAAASASSSWRPASALGNNFLATWAAWRSDPERCRRLHFISIESTPPTRADLASVPRDPSLRALADELAARWPPRRLATCTGSPSTMARSSCCSRSATSPRGCRSWLRELDAFFLDGFAPARNPAMWDARLFKAMARLARTGGDASRRGRAARAVRDGLQRRRLRGRARARQPRQARHHRARRSHRASCRGAGRRANRPPGAADWRVAATTSAGRHRRRRPRRLRPGRTRPGRARRERRC